MMLFKCCTQYASKFGKLSSGQRAGKGYFSSQSQGRAMPKNIQTTTQLLISHTGKVMLKILQARLQQYVNCELPDVQAEFRRRQRNQRFQHLLDHRKNKRIPENHLLYWLRQSLWLCIRQQLWKILKKEMRIP